MTATQLIEIVAQKSRLPEETVKLIFRTLAETVGEVAIQKDTVGIADFGKWALVRYEDKGRIGYFLRFRTSRTLKQRMKEAIMGMDKYAVEQDDEKTKTAETGMKCPKCGSAVETNTNVLKCPKCGTEPFEKGAA